MRLWGARAACGLAALLGAPDGAAVDGAVPPVPDIDRSPALVIGSHRISHYLFDKYHRRFADAWQSEKHRPPTPDETRAWLEHFASQQLVIAHAASLGYPDRSEVRQTVERMERHMLTQPGGPLYQAIATPPPPAEDELRKLFAAATRAVDVLLIRFADDRAGELALGGDFDRQPPDEQTRRVRQAQDGAVETAFEGRLVWPYEPFSEISPLLASAEPGRWIRHAEPGFGTYVFQVRAFALRAAGDFERSRTTFANVVRETGRRTAQKRHRFAQLRRAELDVNREASARLLAYCQSLPEPSPGLPDPPRDLAAMPLLSYWDGKVRVPVSVGAYRQSFNARFLRRVPRSTEELRATLEEYVVGELDLALARAQGLDQSPQFDEDRRGFAGLQVLDLYEREVLAPKIEITPGETARYYQAHSTEFATVGPVRGRLRSFRDPNAAIAWAQRYRADGTTADPAMAVVAERDLELTAASRPPGLENLFPLARSIPAGGVVGPLAAGGIHHVFVRERATADPAALPEVREAIRFRLLREKLDTRIDELARELAPRYGIEDHIDYGRYGVDPAGPKLWQSP